jgi:hypothetical protein
MPNGIWTLALGAAMQVGVPGPSETPNFPALPNAYQQYGFEGQYEQRYPLDTQQNWVHGYFQEIPAYGGHAFFRPYNYKDILSQSQVSAGWGHSPVLPYSQQFWHKYHDQATMLKLSQQEGPSPTYAFDPSPTASEPLWRRPAMFVPPRTFAPSAPAVNGPELQPVGQQFVLPR